MKRPAHRVAHGVVLLLAFTSGIFLCAPGLRAQLTDAALGTRSVSGQFIIHNVDAISPLQHDPAFATNANYVRIEPALLAVSAERFKNGFLRLIGLPDDSPWTGNIILNVRGAKTPDETVTLSVGPLVRTWACQVELPDLITVPRYSRAMCSALLLEYADRSSTDLSHVPELPSWLADGMGRQIMADDMENTVVSVPSQTTDGVMEGRTDETQRGIDPLADARKTLQNNAALTFDQLCWPSPAQLDGVDGGVYAASAQLLTARLLDLPNGPALMRTFLAKLSSVLNWQTAFYATYREYFRRPLDVEKWWSLQVVRFAIRDPGPHWTTATSQERLDKILAVPVEYRSTSNSLPVHTEVSYQAVILNFAPAQRHATLDLKLRDLELAVLRLAPPFSSIAMGYITALRDYLGENPRRTVVSTGRANLNAPHTASSKATLQKLDELDKIRRDTEIHLANTVPGPGQPRNLNQSIR